MAAAVFTAFAWRKSAVSVGAPEERGCGHVDKDRKKRTTQIGCDVLQQYRRPLRGLIGPMATGRFAHFFTSNLFIPRAQRGR